MRPLLRLSLLAALRFALPFGVFVALAGAATAQPAERYWIFFRDRADAPAAMVTPEAEARRALRGTSDVPAWATTDVAPGHVAILRALGVEPVLRSRWLNAVTAPLTPALRAAVEAQPFVREVRPVARVERAALPEAPAEMPDYGASAFQLRFVGADQTLEAGYTGAGVRLGFLDTLFDFGHPALAHVATDGRLLGVQDFTGQSQSNYHGLATSSVAMGRAEGALYGPAHGASVLAATTEYAPTETHVEEDYFIAGLEWLESQGVDVVSVSLGYSDFDPAGPGPEDYTYAMLDGDTTPFTRAVDRAAALGVLVVVSMGNEGGGVGTLTAPADADSALAVAAATADSARAVFSSTGPTADGRTKPDVAALGVGVRVALANGGYSSSSGTSFAAPMAAAVACQLLQADPTLTPMEVIALMRQTASQAGTPDNQLGWGILSAPRALAIALNLPPPPTGGGPALALHPNVLLPGEPLVAVVTGPAGPFRLDVVDLLGRRVAGPVDAASAGVPVPVSLATRALAAGGYFVRLQADGRVVTQRLTVAR